MIKVSKAHAEDRSRNVVATIGLCQVVLLDLGVRNYEPVVAASNLKLCADAPSTTTRELTLGRNLKMNRSWPNQDERVSKLRRSALRHLVILPMKGVVPVDPKPGRTLHHRQHILEGTLADLRPVVPIVDDMILNLVTVRLRF